MRTGELLPKSRSPDRLLSAGFRTCRFIPLFMGTCAPLEHVAPYSGKYAHKREGAAVRIRVTEVEASPEEVSRSPEIAALLSVGNPATPHDAPAGNGRGPDLPREIEELLRDRAGTALSLYRRVIQEALALGDVDPRLGQSDRTADGLTGYVRLHRLGSGLGAFLYVHPRRKQLRFRLEANQANGARWARGRSTQNPHDPYRVVMRFTSEDQLDEALRLMRLAYDGASTP